MIFLRISKNFKTSNSRLAFNDYCQPEAPGWCKRYSFSQMWEKNAKNDSRKDVKERGGKRREKKMQKKDANKRWKKTQKRCPKKTQKKDAKKMKKWCQKRCPEHTKVDILLYRISRLILFIVMFAQVKSLIIH